MKTIGIDFETSEKPVMHPWQSEAYPVMFGIAYEDGTRKTWVFNHSEVPADSINRREILDEIQREINTAGRLVGHNIKFDLNWLRHLGIDFKHCKVYCTQVAEYLINNQRSIMPSLEDLSEKYLKSPKHDKVKIFWDAGYRTVDIPMNILKPYLEQDCINTLAIFQYQSAKIMRMSNMPQLVKVQCESSRVLSEIEYNGMKFNLKIARAAVKELSKQVIEIDSQLLEALKFDCNINSNDELSAALFGGILKRDGREYYPRKLKAYLTAKDMCPLEYKSRKCITETQIAGAGFRPAKGTELKKEGYYSTDKGAIKHLVAKTKKQKTIKSLLLERSGTAKALETLSGKDDTKGLVNKVQADGCIHSQYNQTIAKTGRLSSSDPNGQNLPRKETSPIKRAIEPRFDYILGADLSQLEWRIAAFTSQDKIMCDEIRAGYDPHTDNTVHIFKVSEGASNFDETRTTAKTFSFRMIYGGSAYGFYMDTKMPNFSQQKWADIVEGFYDKYQGLQQWQQDNISKVYQDKGLLYSPTGRIYEFHRDGKGYRKPQICNFPVQGLATADIMPLAMCIIWKKFRAAQFKSKLIMQVHDSLIFDAISAEVRAIGQLCLDVFNNLPMYIEKMWGFKFNLPLTGEIELGRNYQQMKKIDPKTWRE